VFLAHGEFDTTARARTVQTPVQTSAGENPRLGKRVYASRIQRRAAEGAA
jgi:hypothetical protein